jgi:choline dehydrogenase-like flavoprotein
LIRDFLTYDGAEPLRCDLCIAGAGAAGITLALQFVDSPLRVVVLEGGGLEFASSSQALYQGTSVGVPYHPLDVARLRYFGGSTNHWGGMCSPLDPIDFERRDWVAHSGWPIGLADLEPYYARAHPILGLGEYNYVPEEVVPPGIEFLPLRADRMRGKMWRIRSLRLGAEHRDALKDAANIDVLLHANLVEIVTAGEASTVESLRVATLDGRGTEVKAQLYVLALGGIENPRLLLNSDRVMAAGLGNQNDLVGRFFMDHLALAPASVLATSQDWLGAYEQLPSGDFVLHCGIRPSREAQARDQILNSAVHLGAKATMRQTSPGYIAARQLRRAVLEGESRDDLARLLWEVITDLDGLVAGIRERSGSTAYLYTQAEQAPNPASRVRLNAERDPLGLRRVELDWRLSEQDKRTVRALAQLLGEELGRLGLGRAQLEAWMLEEGDAWLDEMVGHSHHLGTTRMAAGPREGVVDRDCRVFGIGNLYIAGSSVFPTSGAANPTLTIVALTLRLADHLARRLA